MKDELAGVFKSANQYRGGRGSDAEDLLSYYDGTGGTVLRADGLAADLDGLLLSVFGSIQPKVLQKMLGDGEDSNGNWARFIFVNQPLAKSNFPTDGGKFDLTPRLVSLYEQLAKLPAKNYRLDKEAFELYRQAYLKLEDLRCDVNTKPAMSHVWGKSEGRIGKLALVLHKVNAIIAGVEPPELIGKETIKAAIALTNFYARQVEALYATLDGKTELPGNLAKIIELAERKGDYILPRDVIVNTSQKLNSVQVKQWFTQLAELGYGETQKTARSLKFKLTIRNVDNVDINVDTTINIDINITNIEDETLASKGLNNVDNNVDGGSTLSTLMGHERKNGGSLNVDSNVGESKKGENINVTNIPNLEDENLTSKGLNNVDNNVDGGSTLSTLMGHERKNGGSDKVDSNVGGQKIRWVRLKDGRLLNCHEYSGEFDRRGYIYGRQSGLTKKEKAHRAQVIEIRYCDDE